MRSAKVKVSNTASGFPHWSVVVLRGFLVKDGWSTKFPELSRAPEVVTL
jgi:hypothetical protein